MSLLSLNFAIDLFEDGKGANLGRSSFKYQTYRIEGDKVERYECICTH